jgi:hypothetical protein
MIPLAVLDDDLPPRPSADWFGFCVRFAFGAMAGGFASLIIVVESLYHASIFRPANSWLVLVSVLPALGGGLGAAYAGDRWWYNLFGRDR